MEDKKNQNQDFIYAPSEDSKFNFFWETSSPFSQWAKYPFKEDKIIFPTTEHYMMYHKAMLFEDRSSAAQIMLTSSPKKVKSIGRSIKHFNEDKWKKYREKIVFSGNYLKFSQNKKIKDILLSTGDEVIVEASPYDKVWGIGLRSTSPHASHPREWRGLNLLGKCLMKVRHTLR